jgi:hypothetical protein
MTRSEFNKKVRALKKRTVSSKNSSLKLTKPTKEILLYSFYFTLRYEDLLNYSRKMSGKISKAENCFKGKGKTNYDHKKALAKANKIMGWSNEGKGEKKQKYHPETERSLVSEFRATRTFLPKFTREEILEQIWEEHSLKDIEPESKEKSIQRLSQKYPRELNEDEISSLSPDPDTDFADLDIMIHELITD